MLSICSFQPKFSRTISPRNLTDVALAIKLFFISNEVPMGGSGLCGFQNTTYFAFAKFKDNLFLTSQLLTLLNSLLVVLNKVS